jgi:hypothetical protein
MDLGIKTTNEEIALNRVKRMDRVHKALGWKGGKEDTPFRYVTWKDGDYETSLNKPGKEAAPDYIGCRYKDGHRGNNPNDMFPQLTKSGKAYRPISFNDVFEELNNISRSAKLGKELLGFLIFRSAYMIDHRPDSVQGWKYHPPQETIKEIEKEIPFIYNAPIEAFLQHLDCLGWNEDVKYFTLGYDVEKGGYGRLNNMLTYLNILALTMNKIEFSKVVGGFSRPPAGVSPISRKKAYEVFPQLGDYKRLSPGKRTK